MEAYLCAEWDGSHVWAQWTPVPDAKEYELRLRYGTTHWTKGTEWSEDWQTPMVSRKPWLSFWPNKPPGTLIQGQVRVKGNGDDAEVVPPWTDCVDVKFTKSRCKFQISSRSPRTKPFILPADVKIHAHVDGAACSYVIPQAIRVEPGQSIEVECEALASGGYMQLDRAGDFRLMPSLGVIIENVEPSRNDIEPTGRDYSVLVPAKRDGPFSIAFIAPQNLG